MRLQTTSISILSVRLHYCSAALDSALYCFLPLVMLIAKVLELEICIASNLTLVVKLRPRSLKANGRRFDSRSEWREIRSTDLLRRTRLWLFAFFNARCLLHRIVLLWHYAVHQSIVPNDLL
jgi:hypothetical protein